MFLSFTSFFWLKTIKNLWKYIGISGLQSCEGNISKNASFNISLKMQKQNVRFWQSYNIENVNIMWSITLLMIDYEQIVHYNE